MCTWYVVHVTCVCTVALSQPVCVVCIVLPMHAAASTKMEVTTTSVGV